MIYDFDNNGVAEGVTEYSYDSAGRLVSERYAYADDGVPDTDFATFSLGVPSGAAASNQVTTYTYDGDGNLASMEIVNDAETITGVYAHGADGRYLTADYDTFAHEVTYDSDRVDHVDTMVGGSAVQGFDYSYLAGQVSRVTWTQPGSAAETYDDFEWYADGWIKSITTTTNTSSVITYRTFTYDSGKPTKRLNTRSDGTDTYSWTNDYGSSGYVTRIDLEDDGSVEATVTVEFETGECVDVWFWGNLAEPNFAGPGTAPFIAGSGYAKLACYPD